MTEIIDPALSDNVRQTEAGVTYIDNPAFHVNDRPDFMKQNVRRISGRWYIPFLMGETNEVRRSGLGIPRGQETPWSREEENTIFLQYNYYRFVGNATGTKIIESQIAEANLGLVCSMVMKYGPVDGDRDDAISEAQAAMLRAVDKFDCSKSYKFSTYCCAAIFRALVRRHRKGAQWVSRFGVQHDERMDRVVRQEPSSWADDEAHLSHVIGLTDLTPREATVIELRFFNDPPLTLVQVGEQIHRSDGTLGVTKEAVRQIQESALGKLKKKYIECLIKSQT